ncbi:hypothetical protein UA08_02112 [Talaromyces atroroseus]|uniref:Asteroid domain-containing protein n=1 Tax=Talaromyces atroroseus TaxID=1441469 RepID=A0A1Q5QBM6_TALAT|nr:hypothetical protein UA08_02112 [Talaromyces atroroseus]OKL63343.1 hypothetical protein UA08_02112 [Talaromyces atroroseus]
MGISHMTRHLSSLSESILLGKSHIQSAQAVRSAVIDGPGLVYHVYSILLAQASTHISQIERQPSCDEVSVAVMTYLVLLQISGVNINMTSSKIYFDGALPLHKRETRLSRLEISRKQLETFCLTQRDGFRLSSIERRPETMHPRRLLGSHNSAVKRAKLPGNPFMVSAVTEDLKSRWTAAEIKSTLPRRLASLYERNVDDRLSDLTEIVPGEADMFCASLAAQKPGTAILTSDSDLLVFELGPDSSVILFDTIYSENWDDEDPTQSMIKAMRFCPASISDRLGIPALSYLAHEMELSPRSTLVELVRRAKDASQSNQKTPAYISFLKEYDLTNFQYNPSKSRLLQNYDTRISELLAQCFWSDEFQDQTGTPRIYLPFLVEDHSRRCAWTDGARIRRLAYSLINMNSFLTEKYPTINECVRRGRRFCFDDVACYSEQEEIEAEATRLIDGLEFVQNVENSPLLFWRLFALYEVRTDWFMSQKTQNIPPQDYRDGLKAFLGIDSSSRNKIGVIDWDNVHALAQLQAVLYSLRMVFQVTRDLELGDGPVKKLRGLLAGLPPLHVLTRSFHEVRREFHGDFSSESAA